MLQNLLAATIYHAICIRYAKCAAGGLQEIWDVLKLCLGFEYLLVGYHGEPKVNLLHNIRLI